MVFSRRPGARFNRGRIATAAAVSSGTQTPLQILGASLLFWMPGNTGAVLSGGDVTTVTTYTDQSSTGNNMTTLAPAQRPNSEMLGCNGYTSLWFETNDSLVANTDWIGMGGTDKVKSFGFVAWPSSNATAQYYFSSADLTVATNYFGIYTDATGLHVVKRNGTTTKTVNVGDTPDTLPHYYLVTISATGKTVEVQKDGVVVTAAGDIDIGGAMTCTGTGIGLLRRSSTTGFLTGRMREFFAIDGTLTAGQKTSLNAYMAQFTASTAKRMLFTEVNSHTETYPSNPKISWVPSLTLTNTDIWNIAHQGDTLVTDGLGRLVRLQKNRDAGRAKYCAVMMTGPTNDFAVLHRTDVQAKADMETWAAGLRSTFGTQIYIIGTTVPPRTDCVGADETSRVAFNSALIATPGSYDLIVDVDAYVQSQGLMTNPAVSPDGVHFTAAVAAGIAALIQSALTAQGFT